MGKCGEFCLKVKCNAIKKLCKCQEESVRKQGTLPSLPRTAYHSGQKYFKTHFKLKSYQKSDKHLFGLKAIPSCK